MLKNDVSSNKSEIKKIHIFTDKSTGDIHDASCRTDRIENYLKKFLNDLNNTYERFNLSCCHGNYENVTF